MKILRLRATPGFSGMDFDEIELLMWLTAKFPSRTTLFSGFSLDDTLITRGG